MSEQEKWAIVGKAVSDYGEATTTLAALKSQASNYAATLRKLAGSLHRTEDQQRYSYDRLGSKEWHSELEKLPTREQLSSLADQISSLEEKKHELHKSLKEMGYEPKELN